MNYSDQLKEELDERWRKTEILNNLIHSSIQKMAEDVCDRTGNSLEFLDSAKLGCYIAWTERLVSLLEDKNIDRLISHLEGKK